MEIKIDCTLLNEQIQLLDMYAGIITHEHKRELVEGVINLLDKIAWAVEEEEDVAFVRIK